MQTFLPYRSFRRTAKCLDYKRLGKQRLEAHDIFYLAMRHVGGDVGFLLRKSIKHQDLLWKRYRNHPAVLMWVGYEYTLREYYFCIVTEWKLRGYKHSMYMPDQGELFLEEGIVPPWLGKKSFHDSHRSNLLKKDLSWYKNYDWDVSNDLEYVWPVKKGDLRLANK